MTIKFEQGRAPTDQELLDQAAGVQIEFVPGSLQETRFLLFCRKLYSAGFHEGMDVISLPFLKTKS